MRFALRLLANPFVILALGLFLLVMNGLMRWLTTAQSDRLERGFHVRGFWSAFWGGLVVSAVSGLLSLMMRGDQ